MENKQKFLENSGVAYSANPQKELTVDGVKFKLKGILPAGDKFKNTVEEKGLVQEGTTTLVYEYVMQIEAPTDDKPEFNEGRVVPIDPPVVEIPEYKLPEEPTPQPDSTPYQNPQPKEEPKLEQPKKEKPKKNLPKEELKREEPKQKDSTLIPSKDESDYHKSIPVNKVEELPQTGMGNEFAIFGAAASSILAGLGLVVPSLKKED